MVYNKDKLKDFWWCFIFMLISTFSGFGAFMFGMFLSSEDIIFNLLLSYSFSAGIFGVLICFHYNVFYEIKRKEGVEFK